MDPGYEQRLRDEVIYLHSLWHQGPPQTHRIPHPHSQASRPTPTPFYYQQTPPNPNPSPHFPFHNQPTNPTFFQTRKRHRDQANAMSQRSDPPPDSGTEWPCSSPAPQTSAWPVMKPVSTPPAQPLSDEDKARSAAAKTQFKAFEPCREFFTKRVGSDNDEEDNIDEEEEEDEDEVEDGSEENEEFRFFMKMFMEDNELRSYYQKNYESGDFYCLVCGGIGKKVWKKFKDCMGLLHHSTSILKTKRKRAHRAFGQVICKVLGWDFDRIPTIVLKGDPLAPFPKPTEQVICSSMPLFD